MASPTTRKAPRGPQAQPAEVSHVSLKNCLVNLPSALVAVLVDSNTVRIRVRP